MKELLKIVCAIIFPPVAAFLQVGLGKHFWINIVLTEAVPPIRTTS